MLSITYEGQIHDGAHHVASICWEDDDGGSNHQCLASVCADTEWNSQRIAVELAREIWIDLFSDVTITPDAKPARWQ